MMKPCLLLLLVIPGLVPLRALAEETSWDPARTYVFVTGVMKWPERAGLTAINGERREDDLIQQLQADGVPASHFACLQDGEATHAAMQRELRSLASRAGEGSTLMFYFQGHGIRTKHGTAFACYDLDGRQAEKTGFRTGEIFPLLSDWQGDRLILFADCCYSGALDGVVKEFEQKRPLVRAASLPSATASNSSTGRWTYTNALISAFAGDAFADKNRNGRITFAELEAFLHDEMKHGEDQLTGAVCSESWEEAFPIRTAKPWPAQSVSWGDWKVGDYLEARDFEGNWYGARIVGWRSKEPNWRIHYCGWEDKWDEWTGADRLRPFTKPGLDIGRHYEVRWHDGRWYRAIITKTVEDYFFFAHYEGEDGSDDEWITASRARIPRNKSARTAPEFAALDASPLAVGQKVAARWHNQWWLARITSQEDGRWHVAYDDGDTGWLAADEIIPVAGRADLRVGDRILACWAGQGRMYPGKIGACMEKKVTVLWEDGSENEDVLTARVTRIRP